METTRVISGRNVISVNHHDETSDQCPVYDALLDSTEVVITTVGQYTSELCECLYWYFRI